MNNLHRELAPISDAAWAEIDEEARRSFARWIAGRRVVDVVGPCGDALGGVPTGHQSTIDANADGVIAHRREVRPVVELRVPFTLSRIDIDDVERGSKDSDWQAVKDAVSAAAQAEDRAIFYGYDAADIEGIIPFTSNRVVSVPDELAEVPEAVAAGLSELKLAGVDGPYALLLPTKLYTGVVEGSDHGYPVLQHIRKQFDGEIIWAPALDDAVLISKRGGDYELHLGRDLSIGYLSHDADSVELYVEESLTFLPLTAEASVTLR